MKGIKKEIGKFANRAAFDLMLFGYVEGVKRALPSVSIEQILNMFANHYKLTYKDFDIDAARSAYSRMKRELIENERINNE